MSGVSAFAFQGTNAHVLLQQDAPQGSVGDSSGELRSWHHSSQWVTQTPHILLTRFRCAHSFECDLSSVASLSYVWDHQVNGNAIFPGAGFFVMASAELLPASPGETIKLSLSVDLSHRL